MIGEIAALPLCFGLPWLSLVFSLANAGLLSLRIRAENAALIGSANVEPPMSPTLQKPVTISVSIGFAMMCVGMFMAILDVQVVATSLPTIQSALAIPPDRMSWVQTAYLIAEVIAIPLTGFLTRALTMRWLFVPAISVFTLASIGCAASESFAALIAWRVLQGFSGGTLIPAVFSAVFLLFPISRQGLATTFAGVLAVLAPTVGPVVGGWITQTYSWHWLFLINVIPGIVSALVASALLPRAAMRLSEARRLDILSLALLAIALAALEIALKEAPTRGWSSGFVLGLLALSLASGVSFVRRTLSAAQPIVDLATFADRSFAIGCVLSFVLGIGLFGSVYLMPVFLAFVREHDAFEIGKIMLVTGLCAIAGRADRGGARAASRCAAADRLRFRAVRAGARAQRGANAARPISTRCSGRRSFAAPRSCFACCRRRDWRLAISTPLACPTPAACSISCAISAARSASP